MKKSELAMDSDVYSFGKTFHFILESEEFPKDKYVYDILNQCIHEDRTIRIQDFFTVKKLLIKGSRKQVLHLSLMKYQWFLLIGCIIIFISIGIYIFHHRQYMYGLAMAQGRYEDAMALRKEVAPYQKGYEEIVQQEITMGKSEQEAQRKALDMLDAWIRMYHVTNHEEIQIYYGMLCVFQDEPSYYRRAYTAFQYASSNFYQMMSVICQILGEEGFQKKDIQTFLHTLKEIEFYVDEVLDDKQSIRLYEWLFRIYRYYANALQENAYEQCLKILDKLKKRYIKEEKLQEVEQLYAQIYYEYGMMCLQNQNYERMNDVFEKAKERMQTFVMTQEINERLFIIYACLLIYGENTDDQQAMYVKYAKAYYDALEDKSSTIQFYYQRLKEVEDALV